MEYFRAGCVNMRRYVNEIIAQDSLLIKLEGLVTMVHNHYTPVSEREIDRRGENAISLSL